MLDKQPDTIWHLVLPLLQVNEDLVSGTSLNSLSITSSRSIPGSDSSAL